MITKRVADTCGRVLSQSGDQVCRTELNLGFFFDGMGCQISKTQYGSTRSNVSKLWTLFGSQVRRDDLKRFHRFYFSGLGTEVNASLAEGFQGSVQRTPDEVAAGAEGQSRGAGLEAGKESISSNSSRPWYETFSRTFKDSFTDWKGWLKEIKAGVIRAGIEVVKPIRDEPLAANLLMSGVSTRLSMAERSFCLKVDEVQATGRPRLGVVRVSVFGFDFGAAIGKRFIRNLLEQTCYGRSE